MGGGGGEAISMEFEWHITSNTFLSLLSKSSPDMKGLARQKRLFFAVKPADRQIRKRKIH